MAIELSEKQIKDGWQIVKFGEIAKNIVERIPPKSGDEKKFIGLEHIVSGSLKVDSWGSETVLKAQAFKIKKGDIIYPKRNTYLRRVAVSPHDCIGSADFIVIRPQKVSFFIPDLLKFIMLSEAFHDFAIANSAGSLSKRTKWKLIAEFEFPLPPIERQKEILEVLEKLEEVDRKTKESIDSLNVLLENTIVEQFNREDGSVLLGDLCEEKRVLVQPPFDTQKKYVGFEHLEPVNVDIPSCGDIADVVSAKAEFYEGNILYGKIRPYLRKAAITPCAGLCSSDLIVIEAKENVSNVVIASILTSSRFSQIAMNSAKGTKMPRADWNTLLKTKLPKSFKTKSSHLERVFLSIYAQKKLLQSKINNITNVRNFVISGNGGVQ